MNEKELQDAAIDVLREHRFLVAHFRPARTADGWRTAGAADHAGFPDIIAVRPGAPIIAVEVKARDGRLSKDQHDWGEGFMGAEGCFYSVLRPQQFPNFVKAIQALDDTHPYPATWGKTLSDRRWRATMKKEKHKLNDRLAAGEGLGPATMTTTLEWTANEPVTINGSRTTYLYKGHQSDGAICVYGPAIWDGGRSKWVPKPSGLAPKFQCFPAESVKRRKP